MDRKKSSDALLVREQGLTQNFSKRVLKYKRLKLTFVCMLILNAILLVVTAMCMIMLVTNMTEKDQNNNPQTDRLKDEQSTRLKCLMIQKKLHRLYKNGQMVEKVNDNDECSMEDLLDSFTQHIEQSMQKEKSNQSAAFHLVSNNKKAERCKDSRTLHCLKGWKLSMNTSKMDIDDESIVVPSSGAYFIYSRVVINAELNQKLAETEVITHFVRYSNTGQIFSDLEKSSIKCGVIGNTMSHISYIEKIQYLEKDSRIKVALNYPRSLDMQDSVSNGVFGMFKL